MDLVTYFYAKKLEYRILLNKNHVKSNKLSFVYNTQLYDVILFLKTHLIEFVATIIYIYANIKRKQIKKLFL